MDTRHTESCAGTWIGRFGIISYSGASAYAFACTERIPDLITEITVVSGICPIRARYGKSNLPFASKLMLSMLKLNPNILYKMRFIQMLKGRGEMDDAFFAKMAKSSIETEKAIVLDPPYQAVFKDSALTTFQQGTAGGISDMSLCFSGWGIDLKRIKTKVLLWHGGMDRSAPLSMTEYMQGVLPNSELRCCKEDGHLSVLYRHRDEIVKGFLWPHATISFAA